MWHLGPKNNPANDVTLGIHKVLLLCPEFDSTIVPLCVFQAAVRRIVCKSLMQRLQDRGLTLCIKCESVYESGPRARMILRHDGPGPVQNPVKSVRSNTSGGNEPGQLCSAAASILWETWNRSEGSTSSTSLPLGLTQALR